MFAPQPGAATGMAEATSPNVVDVADVEATHGGGIIGMPCQSNAALAWQAGQGAGAIAAA